MEELQNKLAGIWVTLLFILLCLIPSCVRDCSSIMKTPVKLDEEQMEQIIKAVQEPHEPDKNKAEETK